MLHRNHLLDDGLDRRFSLLLVTRAVASCTEPASKMRTIARTSAGTTVSGRQTTTTAPSRRKRQSARMGRRAGTRSLRISRNPNTGQGDLLY